VTTTLTHKGYIADITVDIEAGVLHGEVTNARAVLTFSSKAVDGLKAAFEDTIADYLDWCSERGVEPGKPYSGNMTLRMEPALHRAAAERAATYQLSLNSWIVRNIQCELGHRPVSISHTEIENRIARVRDDFVRVLDSRTTIGIEDVGPVWSEAETDPRVLQ